ncbi:vomeronasal type-2 receptor 26-like [Dendropsophus ebraccatus]|uniref:vomeronasal type-2 receptor 26-like n=1 Tax=Dendropsophus ebraccatus TaxID=150705 RepID=UPI0038320298
MDNVKAVRSVLQVLSGPRMTVPNYSCRGRMNVAGFIGDQGSATTVSMAQILGLYRYTQATGEILQGPGLKARTHISYGATSYVLNNRKLYPTFYRTIESTRISYLVLSKMIQSFGWTWVGIVSSDDEMGDEDIQIVTQYLTMNGICVAYTIKKYGDHQEVFSPGHTTLREVPKSQCSDPCPPGTRKISVSSIYSCCYDCVPCSPGEISNMTDSDSCITCSDLHWPNEKKDGCVPKLLEFLSYTDDTIVLVISLVSTSFAFLTYIILNTFILHQDTAIVKANNRNLSFLLLVSIMLSFLCVFLFLGHPVDLTCMLRQVLFGILFSVAVSCVLAKTVMVCIAFRATKPGSSWKSWIGSKWSNSLVLFCSSIQVIICMGWLALAPPFPESDTKTYQGKIIVQCNEGSTIGFYSVLGYLGVLAAVSFITAFSARTLPDSFNEAKYITFSMLVFCSVWTAMIPAYLSTKGKYMVAVEIFAILASCAGLLGCIFFPKCYIILWRPERNSRTHLLEGRRG